MRILCQVMLGDGYFSSVLLLNDSCREHHFRLGLSAVDVLKIPLCRRHQATTPALRAQDGALCRPVAVRPIVVLMK